MLHIAGSNCKSFKALNAERQHDHDPEHLAERFTLSIGKGLVIVFRTTFLQMQIYTPISVGL